MDTIVTVRIDFHLLKRARATRRNSTPAEGRLLSEIRAEGSEVLSSEGIRRLLYSIACFAKTVEFQIAAHSSTGDEITDDLTSCQNPTAAFTSNGSPVVTWNNAYLMTAGILIYRRTQHLRVSVADWISV